MSDITVGQSTRRDAHVDADAAGVAVKRPAIRIRASKRIDVHRQKKLFVGLDPLASILLTRERNLDSRVE